MLLIFDCDGVVVDSMNIHHEVEKAVLSEMGFHEAAERMGQHFAGISLKEIFRILESQSGLLIPPDTDAVMERRKKDVFTEKLNAVDGIFDALADLKNVPRCIASGSSVEALGHMLKLTKLHDSFAPHIFSSDMVVNGKPSPDLFLYAARQMGHAANDCIVIEDAVAGIEAARAANMRVIGFTGGSHCTPEHAETLMGAGAEFVFSSMRQLPKHLKAL